LQNIDSFEEHSAPGINTKAGKIYPNLEKKHATNQSSVTISQHLEQKLGNPWVGAQQEPKLSKSGCNALNFISLGRSAVRTLGTRNP
jgi:hypothetical protein